MGIHIEEADDYSELGTGEGKASRQGEPVHVHQLEHDEVEASCKHCYTCDHVAMSSVQRHLYPNTPYSHQIFILK